MRLFNAKAVLAEIEKRGLPPATPAISATLPTPDPQKVARVAEVAAPQGENQKNGPSSTSANQNLSKPENAEARSPKIDPKSEAQGHSVMTEKSKDVSPYGTSCGGRPLTHTGKVVSLATWRELSEWEKHGPNGKHWNGKTQQWETPE